MTCHILASWAEDPIVTTLTFGPDVLGTLDHLSSKNIRVLRQMDLSPSFSDLQLLHFKPEILHTCSRAGPLHPARTSTVGSMYFSGGRCTYTLYTSENVTDMHTYHSPWVKISLKIEEFTNHAMEFEKDMRSCKQSASDLKMPGVTEVVCQHKNSAVQSGFGLCRNCYLEFCGGLDGSEPPAFQRAEMERLSKESVKSLTDSTLGKGPLPKTIENENGSQHYSELQANAKETDKGSLPEFQCASPNPGKLDKIGDCVDTFESSKDPPSAVDETDTLSDIDDYEVNCYLHNEEETQLKKIVWEHMNKEYMQEQAAKEAAATAAAAAARKQYTGTSEEIREAQALAAAAAAAVASKKEKDKHRRAMEAKNAKPAQSAAEAAGQLFTKKKLSSKINYDVLKDIFDDEPSPKKSRVEGGDEESGKEPKETNDTEYNDDEIEEGHEWNYDDEYQMNGYGDGYDGEDAYLEEY